MKRCETMFLSTRGRIFLHQSSRYEGGNANHTVLQKVDESNLLVCFSLKLEAQQEKFAFHPVRSPAQAYVYCSQCTLFTVCHVGQVVGHPMVIYDYSGKAHFTWHLMINTQHQGRDCGGAATEAALAYIRSKPLGASNFVRLTVNPENATACHLYQILRSSPTDRADGDEIELKQVPD